MGRSCRTPRTSSRLYAIGKAAEASRTLTPPIRRAAWSRRGWISSRAGKILGTKLSDGLMCAQLTNDPSDLTRARLVRYGPIYDFEGR